MYAGHAAVALGLGARAPRGLVALLTIAAYGPDWVELALGVVVGRSAGEVYSHCLPGLAAGALVAWGLTALVLGRGPAALVGLAWLLHWPADFVTAYKPLIDPRHLVGLGLYGLPRADFMVEAVLVVGCSLVYARAHAPTTRQRAWVVAAAISLSTLQGMLDFGLANTVHGPWAPRLARGAWRPQLTFVLVADVPHAFRMPLALSPATSTASEQWQWMDPAASSPWSA